MLKISPVDRLRGPNKPFGSLDWAMVIGHKCTPDHFVHSLGAFSSVRNSFDHLDLSHLFISFSSGAYNSCVKIEVAL